MKAKSKASKTKQDKDSTMSSPTSAVQLERTLFAIAGSVQLNSETTSPDRLNLCNNSTQTPKSSKTLEADSTSSGKDCKPYWSGLCEAISSRLLLPVETGYADSDLNYSSSWLSKTVEKSWFLTEKFTVQKPNSQPIFLPSFTSSLVECTDLEVIARKSKKIRLFLNPEQKALLKQGRLVALDPGVRTFMTFFSENSFGGLGNDSNLYIQRLCFRLDKLVSKLSKASSRQKRRLKKAASRLRCKIKNLVKELHHKTARFLVDNFDVILLPTFETSQMVSKSRRKLRNKSVRQMLTLSHYEFKTFLKWKAWEQSKTVLDCNEAYTSKTVSWTGEIIKNLGGARTIKSLSTGLKMNRDLNGARGIFLRALVDAPWLREHLNLCIC